MGERHADGSPVVAADMKHTTEISPAWDCLVLPSPDCRVHDDCDPNVPRKNYGRGSIRIRHYAITDVGVVEFVWSPGVYIPETPVDSFPQLVRDVSAWDLGWHAPIPVGNLVTDEDSNAVWPWWGSRFDTCEFFAGGCFYDGSSLNADPLLEELRRGGTDAMWPMLDAYYADVFGVSVT